MASTSPSPASLSTPLLSGSIAPARAANGHGNNSHRHHHHHDDDSDAAASVCGDGGGDPFAFLSEDRPPRDRGASPADPFRNATPAWGGGVYAWARTLLLLPVAALRLAMFGLAIAIGYAATWVALRGWADVQDRPREGAGPMPAWRRRLMWITRISARCILFSFG
jgi:lysophosphatidylcholine acyltransferase/lyso-PAF acetyltransferase